MAYADQRTSNSFLAADSNSRNAPDMRSFIWGGLGGRIGGRVIKDPWMLLIAASSFLHATKASRLCTDKNTRDEAS